MSALQGLLRRLGLDNLIRPRERVRVFLLDDDVMRHEWFSRQFKGDTVEVAADHASAIELLKSNHYDFIFLDHDLLPEHYYSETFDDERSGYAVARWLAEHPECLAASPVIVHTRNADGALRMVELMRGAGRYAEHVPFQLLGHRIRRLRGK